MILANARLIFPERIQPEAHVKIANGKITAIASCHLAPSVNEEVIDLAGNYLAPGFIDVHIHGALRCDTMQATTEAFETICKFHARGGTTSLALTTITATLDEILSAIRA